MLQALKSYNLLYSFLEYDLKSLVIVLRLQENSNENFLLFLDQFQKLFCPKITSTLLEASPLNKNVKSKEREQLHIFASKLDNFYNLVCSPPSLQCTRSLCRKLALVVLPLSLFCHEAFNNERSMFHESLIHSFHRKISMF